MTAETAIAHLSHCNTVCPFSYPSVTRVDQSKTVQVRINKSSPLVARMTLVLEPAKLFHKFKKGHPKLWH